jgi:hypothetical protein
MPDFYRLSEIKFGGHPINGGPTGLNLVDVFHPAGTSPALRQKLWVNYQTLRGDDHLTEADALDSGGPENYFPAEYPTMTYHRHWHWVSAGRSGY